MKQERAVKKSNVSKKKPVGKPEQKNKKGLNEQKYATKKKNNYGKLLREAWPRSIRKGGKARPLRAR